MIKLKKACSFGAAVLMTVMFSAFASNAHAACYPTGYNNLTAAIVNPVTVTGTIDATGCDIGVYVNAGEATITSAAIHGALHYGVFANGDVNNVEVDVVNSDIYDIGDSLLNGNQRGIGIYFRAFFNGTATGRISGNTLYNYQKGGIVTNGVGTTVHVSENTVAGEGPVAYIAQNGIQIGYGASATVMKNVVSGHSYTGTSTVSGGIIVVGGPGYGICPDGNSCPYTTNTKIIGNTVVNNDVGLFLTNIDAAGNAPASATNIKANNNDISNTLLANNYGGVGYQAGVSDVGNNDKIVANTITGDGYDPAANSGAYTVRIDADPSFTNRPKVHANK